MFEVECPSCRAGYKVDERRVPATGLKMRCPKCGASFQVNTPGAPEAPVLGAALGLGQQPPPPKRNPKQTMVGIAPAHSSSVPPPAREPSRRDTFELESLDDEDFADAGVGLPQAASSGRATPKEIDLFGASEPPVSEGEYGDEFELPTATAGLPDLPRPKGEPPAELPDLVGSGSRADESDLPSPAGDLPALGGELPSLLSDLPSLGAEVPSPARSTFGELPSLTPESSAQPGSAPGSAAVSSQQDDGFLLSRPPGAPDESFLVGSSTPASSSGEQAGGDSFGELDLGAGDFQEAEDLPESEVGGEFDAFPKESAGSHAAEQDAGYGDVALDEGGGAGGAFGLDSDAPGMASEPAGHSPAGPRVAASAQVELPRSGQKPPKVKAARSGLPRGVKWGIGAALLLAVGGGALGALLPDVGPYGAYALMDRLNRDAYAAALAADAKQADKALAIDSASQARMAFQIVDRGRSSAPRYAPRTALAAYLGFLGEIRFGSGSGTGAAANALLQTLAGAKTSEVKWLELARLASDVAAGRSAPAAKAQLISRGPQYAVLVGEAALEASQPELALQAFEALVQAENSARAFFGVARAKLALGEADAATEAAQAVLERNPAHVGAALLLARRRVNQRKADDALIERLITLSKGEGDVSVSERTEAHTLLGDLALARGRLSEAESAFSEALKLESGSTIAQRGLADALFASGKFSEAQTRYEAAFKSDPSFLAAGLGLVRCRIRLEELASAASLLEQLKQDHPDSTAIQYWLGRVQEELGEREKARAAYELAITKDQPGAELVNSYVALTRVLGQEGKTQQAEDVITRAQKRFPEDPLVYEALAELSASRGSFELAAKDYGRAIALDPNNLGLHFAKAVVLRQGRKFEEAEKELAFVGSVSPSYPGLALERGNLLETSGRGEEALKAYEAALAEAPDSTDMLLRVGCARASAGQGEPAAQALTRVFEERPNSAEVNFCLGLAYLQMPSKLQDARRFLQRAVSFDASRASYHLYVGWVGLELGDFPLAAASLEKALSLDQTLADAYWKRGELRVKQGAVDDAVRDLSRALELAPSRYEAHAQLALAYLQNGREPQALAEFEKATTNPGIDPYFNYRYGELLLNHRRTQEAQVQLEQALAGVEQGEPPLWAWEAHRLLAMSLGRQKAALPHWEAFTSHAPSNSPYLREATREMDAILRSAGH